MNSELRKPTVGTFVASIVTAMLAVVWVIYGLSTQFAKLDAAMLNVVIITSGIFTCAFWLQGVIGRGEFIKKRTHYIAGFGSSLMILASSSLAWAPSLMKVPGVFALIPIVACIFITVLSVATFFDKKVQEQIDNDAK